MPQRNVASNFTFEQQRVEINNLAQDFWSQKGTVDTALTTFLKHDGSNNFTGQTLAVPNAFTINSNSGGGTVTIAGNLDVTGTTTTVSTANLEVTDKNILIAKGSTSDAQADGAGITIDSATDITFNFVDAKDALVSSIGLEATTFIKSTRAQFTGAGNPTTGQGLELTAPDQNTGQIASYDRDSSAYKELRLKGSTVSLYAGTSNALVGTFNSTGLSVSGDVVVGEPASNTLTHSLLVQAGGDANAVAVIGRADGIGELSFYENNASTKQGEVQFRDTELNIRHRKEGAEINFVTCPTGGTITDRLTILGSGQIKCLGGAAGVNALEVTGNYAASGNVDIQTWQRTGGAVQAKMIYKDASTDMHFGTDTAHAFNLMTSGTSRLTVEAGGKVDVAGELAVGSSIGINGSGGSAYPLHVYSGQKYLVGLKNTSANSGTGYPWLVHDSTSGGQSTLTIHFNGIGDRFFIRENGTAQSTGTFTASQLIATQGATTEFIQATSTNNGTRAAGSFEGKDSSGNAVTLKFGGYGDTGRGEIFTYTNHPLGFATNNAAAQLILETSGNLIPADDNSQNLGGTNKRWANVYTGDMHLNNMNTGGNEVDGSEGHWTMQEGADDLFLINRNTGKKYKFNLTEVS